MCMHMHMHMLPLGGLHLGRGGPPGVSQLSFANTPRVPPVGVDSRRHALGHAALAQELPARHRVHPVEHALPRANRVLSGGQVHTPLSKASPVRVAEPADVPRPGRGVGHPEARSGAESCLWSRQLTDACAAVCSTQDHALVPRPLLRGRAEHRSKLTRASAGALTYVPEARAACPRWSSHGTLRCRMADKMVGHHRRRHARALALLEPQCCATPGIAGVAAGRHHRGHGLPTTSSR